MAFRLLTHRRCAWLPSWGAAVEETCEFASLKSLAYLTKDGEYKLLDTAEMSPTMAEAAAEQVRASLPAAPPAVSLPDIPSSAFSSRIGSSSILAVLKGKQSDSSRCWSRVRRCWVGIGRPSHSSKRRART